MTAIEDRLYRECLPDGGKLAREPWTASMTGRSEPPADLRYRDNMCRPGRWTACGSAAWAWQPTSTAPEGSKP